MSIIKPIILEQSAAQLEKARIEASLNTEFRNLRAAYIKMFDAIWNNPKASPQEIFNCFGTEAYQLFVIADAMHTSLNAIQPGTINLSAPLAYTANEDGTITVH